MAGPLTRQKIVVAAVALIEAKGIEALSMRKLAAALGVEAMSLYNHVTNKDALLDAVVDLVIQRIILPAPSGDWQKDIRATVEACRAAALDHPRIVPLLARQVFSDSALVVTDAMLTALRDAGFGVEEAVYAARSVLAYLIGSLLREVDLSQSDVGASAEALAGREAALRASNLSRVAEAAPLLAGRKTDAEFQYGLDLILCALESPRFGRGCRSD